MLLNRSGVKRLAVEGVLALSLAWGSLQLGQVYASEAPCPEGLTALNLPAAAVHHNDIEQCLKEQLAGE